MITSEEILNDPIIKEKYDCIDALPDYHWCNHGIKHINNVIKTIDFIMSKLHYPNIVIECAKIAGVLHDVGNVEGKDAHAERGYNFAIKYLSDKNIPLNYKRLICSAIKNHSEISSNASIIESVLVVADKLDITSDRVTPIGQTIEGNRQLMFIEKIDLTITSTEFNVNIITKEGLNLAELLNYYFIPKMIQSVKVFAKSINRTAKINFDSKNLF